LKISLDGELTYRLLKWNTT